jgi:preprotein translocase subunit SecF
MSTVDTTTEAGGSRAHVRPIGATRWRRLILGQTAIDFWGRRRLWMTISLVLLAISAVSLWQRGLELGIDFEGGVAWDVPADQLSVDDARGVLEDAGIPADQAKIQERTSDSGNIIKVQVGDQPEAVRVELQEAFATAAGVQPADVSVASVSATWGEEITRKALLALIVFLFLIAIYISFRFEWRMAVTALLAMLHDVAISVGIYSVFGFDVTPATVVAFLTVLGYSLYDSIVVFDRIRDNEKRVAAAGLTAGDLINISMNQVLLRSINTTLASSLPVLSLLLIGAGLFGQVTLREFAIALLVGMLTGAYSSLFVASPMLGWLKARSPAFAGRHTGGGDHLSGDDLRAVVIAGPGGVRAISDRRRRATAAAAASDEAPTEATTPTATKPAPTVETVPTERLLTHPPRPRKKKKR